MTFEEANIEGIVVAGGRSTRYGERNKLLVRFDGRPLLERVVAAVGSLTATPPIVVVRNRDQRAAIDAALENRVERRYAFDDPAYDGPLGGIAGALPEIDEPWSVVCAGDMPLVSAEALAWLGDRRTESTDAIVPVRDGVPEPLHALYRCEPLCRELPSLPPDAGPRALCTAVTCTKVPVTTAPEYLKRSLQNVNTPETLERLANRTEDTNSIQ
jgi:molybdopterin-guanine dinucleotide biosynthesis protein A